MGSIVAYFDMQFTKGHKTIFFSTGPHAKYTHWKQTVFYLKDDLAVNTNDEMVQMLTFQQAYQASAKLVSTVDTMMQSLIQAS